MIEAVLFDLDDTLYPQASWLSGAWRRVCASAATWGADPEALYRALLAVTAERGSSGGGIIDQALARVDASSVPVAPLVAAFRSHRPDVLVTYRGVNALLAHLAGRVRTGLVTDGEVDGQRAKLRALGLADRFDVVVYSDALGRDRRKPDPAPFHAALAALDVAAANAVFIGDHPVKDVAGPQALGLRSIRVLTGEYAAQTGEPPWATVPSVADAGVLVVDLLASAGNGMVDYGPPVMRMSS